MLESSRKESVDVLDKNCLGLKLPEIFEIGRPNLGGTPVQQGLAQSVRGERLARRAARNQCKLPAAHAELLPQRSGIDFFHSLRQDDSFGLISIVCAPSSCKLQRADSVGITFDLGERLPASRLKPQVETPCTREQG